MQCIQLNKKAFALVMVLWIVAALLFGAATLALLSKDTLFLTKGVKNKLKTELVVEDVLESLKFYITTADFNNNAFMNNSLNDFVYKFPIKIVADNRWYTINDDIQIRVQDTSALLNVMKILPQAIATVMTKPSQDQLRYIINDSIKDWIDEDNVVSLNGAEASTYEREKSANFKIRNSKSIQNVEELRFINGIDTFNKQNWLNLRENFYYGNGNLVNLTLIDAQYLAFILNIDLYQAQNLVEERNKSISQFIALVLALKTYDNESMGFYLSKELKIEIKSSSNNSTTILKAIIDFKESSYKQYTIIKETI